MSESFIASYDFSAVIHSHIISVRFLSFAGACSILIQTIKVNVASVNRYTGNLAIRLRVTVKFNPLVLVLFI